MILSFWRKDQGLGMIETAVALPLFLVFTFMVIDFGNLYLTYTQSRDFANEVGRFLQANPSISPADLESFVGNIERASISTQRDTSSTLSRLKIQSEKTMKTDTQFDALCQSNVKTWSNPWPNNEPYLYYIHVCHSFDYTLITPLSRLSGGVIPETRTIRAKAIVSAYPPVTCPDGYFINNNSGRPECTKLTTPCPTGQYLVGVNGTTPICKTPIVYRDPSNSKSKYRPVIDTSDCSDADNSVQVGFSPHHAKPVWCGDLKVKW
jgi:hypothetical protein